MVSQYNIQPMIQIYGTTQGRDLGAVAADVQKVIDETAGLKPRGGRARLRDRARRALVEFAARRHRGGDHVRVTNPKGNEANSDDGPGKPARKPAG